MLRCKLVRFLCCGGTLFRVGDERVKTGVSMQRFEVRIFIYAQIGKRGQPVVHRLA